MLRLSDLSVEKLAWLLNLSNAEAEQLIRWTSKSPMLAVSIMNTPVEEIKRLRESGALHKLHPDIPHVPEDVALRWRQLRELLRREPEFETRFPTAYDLLRGGFDQTRGRVGISLPSFGIQIAPHDPLPHTTPVGHYSGDDAYSSSTGPHGDIVEAGPQNVGRKSAAFDLAYLRGVLLAMLVREEYRERIFGTSDPKLLAALKAPDTASVRLTDLRLAMSLKPEALHMSRSERGLVSALRLLRTPITTDCVIQWKWKTLGEHTDLLEQEFGDLRNGTIAVSFATAALCLFIDFDMPHLQNAKPYRLAEQIEKLAKEIRRLSSSLNSAATELDTLLANRPAHRAPRSDNDYYQALWSYRMGCSLENIADQLSITRWNSATPERGGTKGWKRNVEQKIVRGKRVEDERYPRAAAIFDKEDNPFVRRKALEAYAAHQDYLREQEEDEEEPEYYLGLWAVGVKIRANGRNRRGHEIVDAYIQLGCCIEQDRPLLP